MYHRSHIQIAVTQRKNPLVMCFLYLRKEVLFMKSNFKKWLKAAAVRAVKTVAQTAVATVGTSAVMSQVDWRIVASASVLAGILSLLTSAAGLPEVED